MAESGFRRNSRRGILIATALILLAVTGLCEIVNLVIPRADGSRAWQDSGATLDASHADIGYIMVKKKSSKKLKVRIVVNDTTYTYDLNGEGSYEVYPLQQGSGDYKIVVYENVRGNSYAQLLSKTINVKMDDEKAAFLCPNRYVSYDGDTQIINYAQELFSDQDSNREKAEKLAKWMKQSFSYDYITALTVKSGYVPDLDATFERRLGMCFDFSAMMCAVMRSQGIPAQLVMGDADGTYHAWCKIWLDEKWVLFDPTMDIMGNKVSNYIEEAYY